jgi:hypothetical protein
MGGWFGQGIMPTRRASFRTQVLYPALQTAVAGCLAYLLADSVGWPAQPIGLAVALALWTWQIVAALPAPKQAAPVMLPQEVRVRVLSDDGTQGLYLRFGIDAERLREFAEGVTAGQSLSLRTWSPRLFRQAEFTSFIAELVKVGLAAPVSQTDPRGGVALTGKGHAIFRGLATAPLAPEVVQNSRF